MRATFQNSVRLLVEAYFNDSLNRMDCRACGAGNIIKGSMPEMKGEWAEAVLVLKGHLPTSLTRLNNGMLEINSSGYTVREILEIERAFMGWGFNDYGYCPSQDNFDALMRTVDKLAEIHGIDLTEKESAKALFVKA